MADVIKEADLERLVSCAKKFSDLEKYSPVQIIKEVMTQERCSLSEAKEAYTLASQNETLGQYQERVILPLMEELEKHDEFKDDDN